MSEFFEHVRGGVSLYVDGSKDAVVADVRFCLMRHGESPALVLKQFYNEHPTANFLVCPLTAHGEPPRRELCTAQSLSAALQSVELDPDGAVTGIWKEIAEELCVVWPRRLSHLNSPKPAEMQP